MKQVALGQFPCSVYRSGAMGQINRKLVFASQCPDTINVVTMFMRNHNSLKVRGAETETTETPTRLGFGKSAVKQDACIASLN